MDLETHTSEPKISDVTYFENFYLVFKYKKEDNS